MSSNPLYGPLMQTKEIYESTLANKRLELESAIERVARETAGGAVRLALVDGKPDDFSLRRLNKMVDKPGEKH